MDIQDYMPHSDARRLIPIVVDELEACANWVSRRLTNGSLDRHWFSAAKPMGYFLMNEFWLIWRRREIDPESIASAKAAIRPLRQTEALEAPTAFSDATLLAHAMGRFVIWHMINMPPIQKAIQQKLSAEMPSMKMPVSQECFTYALIYRELHLFGVDRYTGEFAERVAGNDLKKHTILTLWGDTDSYQWLQKLSRRIARNRLPEGSDWGFEASAAISKWIVEELGQKPIYSQMRSLGITKKAIERNLIDKWRNLKKQPEHLSFEAMEEAQGKSDSPPAFKMSLPSTSLQESVRPLTDWQLAQLDKILGETGRKIFAYVWHHPDVLDDGRLIHGAKKEIAKAVGCAQSTVGAYWGEPGKIQWLGKKICEIL